MGNNICIVENLPRTIDSKLFLFFGFFYHLHSCVYVKAEHSDMHVSYIFYSWININVVFILQHIKSKKAR